MPDTKYTVVQHSAWAGKQDPQFEHGLESAALSTAKEEKAVLKAGGLVFDTYGKAEDFAEAEQYPSERFSIIPNALGTFAQLTIGGRAVYLPKRKHVRVAHVRCGDSVIGNIPVEADADAEAIQVAAAAFAGIDNIDVDGQTFTVAEIKEWWA